MNDPHRRFRASVFQFDSANFEKLSGAGKAVLTCEWIARMAEGTGIGQMQILQLEWGKDPRLPTMQG